MRNLLTNRVLYCWLWEFLKQNTHSFIFCVCFSCFFAYGRNESKNLTLTKNYPTYYSFSTLHTEREYYDTQFFIIITKLVIKWRIKVCSSVEIVCWDMMVCVMLHIIVMNSYGIWIAYGTFIALQWWFMRVSTLHSTHTLPLFVFCICLQNVMRFLSLVSQGSVFLTVVFRQRQI